MPPYLFRLLTNRYSLTALLFGLWMLFFDSNSLWNQWKVSRQIEQLNNKAAYYDQEIKIIDQALNELERNATTQEKFAREHYLMKRPNEEVFVVEEE